MSAYRFLRKKGKVLGPLSASRIEQLLQDGKLTLTDELSVGREGPWKSVQTIQEEKEKKATLNQSGERKREAAAEAISSAAIEVTGTKPTDPFGQMSDFSSTPSLPPPISSSPGTPSPVSPFALRNPRENTSRDSKHHHEELDATNPWRWVFPWKWQTQSQPFPMLVVYLKFSKVSLIVAYLVSIVAGLISTLFFVVSIIAGLAAGTESTPTFFSLIMVILGAPLFLLCWLAICQFIYISGMAGIDLLRCLLAIERNTR